ncbi:MAG: hypothetical protein EP312_08095, partial [Gammaproteobacteria bacterium]
MDADKAHEGVWLDWEDIEAKLARKIQQNEITEDSANNLRFFAKNGYVILKEAVSRALADQICADMQAAPASPGKFFGNARRKPMLANDEAVNDSKFRFIDFHVNSPAAREAIFSPAIRNFLHQVYEGPVLAFQSLLFRVGSQQRMHQDTAYVVISKP